MSRFNSADWLVILVYLAGIFSFGVWFGKDQKTTRDYFLGSRNLPWWGVGLSIISAETSALTFIGVPAMAYGGDLTFIQIIIGYVLARIVLAVVMVPRYLRREIYSPYQLLTRSFGPSAGRLAGAFFLLGGTLAAGVRVYVTCIPLELMLGIDVLTCIVLFVAFALSYTYVGGIKAVIWTDVVQFTLFVAGGVFTLVYIPTLLKGGFSGALGLAAQAGKLHWFNSHFSWSLPFNIWMGVCGATVQVMASHGADQLIVQRVLTCRSVADGRKALVLSAVIVLPLFLVFLFTGVMLWVYYQQVELPIALPATQAGFKRHDYIYPIFIVTALPHVFKGFLIVAVLSAAIGSVCSALSALASVMTMDFLKGFLSRPNDEALVFRVSRYATAFAGLMLVLVAYASREAVLVLNWAFSLNGLTSGGMLGGVLLALVLKRASVWVPLTGMLSSLVVLLAIQIWGKGTIAWPWFTLMGTLITFAGASLVLGLQKVTGNLSVSSKSAT